MSDNYNYNYENDSSSIINSLNNNSIKIFNCSLCNQQSSILKNSQFIQIVILYV